MGFRLGKEHRRYSLDDGARLEDDRSGVFAGYGRLQLREDAYPGIPEFAPRPTNHVRNGKNDSTFAPSYNRVISSLSNFKFLYGAKLNWWLWNAWITGTDDSKHHFYAFLAPTTASNGFSDLNEVALPSGAVLIVAQKVLDDVDASALVQLHQQRPAEIDLSAHWPQAPTIPTRLYRTVFAEAFGHSAARVDCGYGLPEPVSLFPASIDIPFLIDFCTEQLGLPFRETFSNHLGGFDVFHLDAWLDQPQPFGSRLVKNGLDHDRTETLRFWRCGETLEQLIVQACARAHDEVVLDRAFIVGLGCEQLDIPLPEPIDSYELRVFGCEDGALVYRESTVLLREINFNMRSPAQTLVHSDRLSRKATAHGTTLGQRGTATTAFRTSRSLVSLPESNNLRAHGRLLRNMLDEHLGEHSEDRWFPRTFASELDVIDYINLLLDTSQTPCAILVDPFFGQEALQRLALRLPQSELELTVVSSWGRTDPDTGESAANGSKASISESTRRLASLFAQIGPAIVPRFKFVNLVCGSGSQAFHDRYLLLYSHEGSFRVFLLSNSVNGMAANWPFCISRVTGRAGKEAKRYIEGLANGYDVTNSTSPQITFRWPGDSSQISPT
jgi:hypothetical protein